MSPNAFFLLNNGENKDFNNSGAHPEETCIILYRNASFAVTYKVILTGRVAVWQLVGRRSTWRSCWIHQAALTTESGTHGIWCGTLWSTLYSSSTSARLPLTSASYDTATTPKSAYISTRARMCFWRISCRLPYVKWSAFHNRFNHHPRPPPSSLTARFRSVLRGSDLYYMHTNAEASPRLSG